MVDTMVERDSFVEDAMAVLCLSWFGLGLSWLSDLLLLDSLEEREKERGLEGSEGGCVRMRASVRINVGMRVTKKKKNGRDPSIY